MQSMPSIASYMDFDFKLLQRCGCQSKPLGSLRMNLQVEGMNRGGSWRDVEDASHPPPAIFNNALDE